MGLPINWSVIKLGWEGIGSFGRVLSGGEIEDYACEYINKAKDFEIMPVSDLCSGQNIDDSLQILAPKYSDNDVRVWLVYLLAGVLENASNNYIDGLSDINSFWGSFNFPDYMPYSVQGLHNSTSAIEYYSAKNYAEVLKLNQCWLEEQIELLRNHRSDRI